MWSTKLQQNLGKHIVVEAKVNHDTHFYRIKGGFRVPPLTPSPITFETANEIL